MQVPKPTDADKERFRTLVPEAPGVEVKPMFGNLGGFVNGNMFMGLFGPLVGVKLAPGDEEQLRAVEGATPFGPPERPMAGWVTLAPGQLGTADGPRWIARALEHGRTRPPKKAKAKG
jgi:hypothetical protein